MHSGFDNVEIGFDNEASKLLSNKMLGQRFDMEYNEDFIIVKDGGPDVMLQRVIEDSDTVYRSERQEGDKTIQYNLYMNPKSESNTLVATAKWMTNEVDTLGNPIAGKIARTRCKIKKYENK